MSVSYCFNYYAFVVLLEIRKCDAFIFVLSWDCLGSVKFFMTVQVLGFFFFYFSKENKTRLITLMTIYAKILYQMLAKLYQQFINKVIHHNQPSWDARMVQHRQISKCAPSH